MWRMHCAHKRSLRWYERVRTDWPRYQEYLEHPDKEVNLVRWRLRTGFAAVAEYLGRWNGTPLEERVCQCNGCEHPGVESTWHMIMECDRWAERRLALVASILGHLGISRSVKNALGNTMQASPDLWWRLLMCAPLPELGEEYVLSWAQLTKRISSRMWDDGVSDEMVARARQALSDRRTVMWVTGRQLRAWYLERAQMAGYSRV